MANLHHDNSLCQMTDEDAPALHWLKLHQWNATSQTSAGFCNVGLQLGHALTLYVHALAISVGIASGK